MNHPDISNEEKSVLGKNSPAANLSEIRRIVREHRETVGALKKRCEKMEHEDTKILQAIQYLGRRLRDDWKD